MWVLTVDFHEPYPQIQNVLGQLWVFLGKHRLQFPFLDRLHADITTPLVLQGYSGGYQPADAAFVVHHRVPTVHLGLQLFCCSAEWCR